MKLVSDVPEHWLLLLQHAITFIEVAAVAIERFGERFEIYGNLYDNELCHACFCGDNKNWEYTGRKGERELVAHLVDWRVLAHPCYVFP